MKTRNLTIDLARGFIVFIMPATHATLYYSQMAVQKSVWGFFLRIFAEGAGAQTFMFLLGFSFFLGRKKAFPTIVKRSCSIFLLAYVLNFIKFVIPNLGGLIPQSLFTYYHLATGFWGTVDLFMVGDIFQFAAIAYLICGTLYHFKINWWVPLIIAMTIAIISPLVWGHRLHNFFIDYFFKFLNGAPPAVFFPAFPWMTYPLMGLSFGYLFKVLLEQEFYKMCLKVGLILLLIGMGFMWFEPDNFSADFYRLGPGGTIFHAGLLLLWICLCHLLVEKINPPRCSQFFGLMTWYSTNITIIYVIQWILVIYCLPFFGFMTLGTAGTLMAAGIISLLTYLFVKLIKSYRQRFYLSNRPQKRVH